MTAGTGGRRALDGTWAVDGGRTWRTVDTGSYDTVDCTPDLGCWVAGEQGRVARLES